jgi:NAD(P)H-hydrate repair Nnr-like enzyme with NAD(P)H-hydrate dehydratase domain
VGPGLGRDPAILDTVAMVMQKARQMQLPLVVDAV